MRTRTLTSILAALSVTAVAGCSTTGSSETKHVYDFGPHIAAAPATASATAPRRVTIAVSPMVTSEEFDSPGLVYRLGYTDAQQPRRYANSAWTASPAELLTRRLKSRLAERANVVSEGDLADSAVLKIELEEFSQVFDGAQSSHAIIEMRATLVRGGKLVAQHTFVMQQVASTPDANGGAHALAALADSSIDAIVQWSLVTLNG